jgi:DNA-binding SARP family transcriptional activator/ABC-type branched-subunit amino acid transport system substrate-binding protein/sugar lactone lactonase YvrE
VERGLDFLLLGPLEVRDDGRPVHLGGVRQRSVLAILLLHAGRVVPADTLIDELWGDAPPADAASALQQHVSRLRRLLAPHAVVETIAPGYLVRPPPGGTDVARFEALRAEGRDHLAAGRADEAAEALRAALGQWRGRALADLAHEQFAVAAVEALEEERLEALELRVDADLALGRHAELVPELRTLVARHPLRERLRAQLVLALYRCGRQADALDAYADARRTLVDELGLEPGPDLRRLQDAVLRHEPGLELPPAPGVVAPARRRRFLRHTVPTLAAVAVAAAGAAFATRGDAPAPAVRPAATGGELVALDAATGRIARRLPAGRTPAALARTDDGRLWVVDADARTLLAVDPGAGTVEALATGGTPTDVAAAGEGVWVGDGEPVDDAQFAGPVTTAVRWLDAPTRGIRATVELPRTGGTVGNTAGNRLAVSARAAWAVGPSGAVVRIDRTTGAETNRTRRAGAFAVAATGRHVWALRPDGVLLVLDEASGEVRGRIELPTDAPARLAAGAGAAWVTAPADGRVFRVEPAGDIRSVVVGRGASEITAGPDGAWVADTVAGTLQRIDAQGGEAGRPVRVGGMPRALLIADGTLWVAVEGRAPEAGSSSAAGLRALPAPPCEPAIAGGAGAADVLLVSDLPLQGGVRITATQMAQAIAFVLRERGFRAGRFRVAYQSCDDSIARTGLYDEAKCAANARAYGARREVVAVIGTLNSPCAEAALPHLNRAPGGPVGMVSPLNSFVGLTRPVRGRPELPAALHPTGRRSYLRVFPTDDLQGAALAMLARERGRRAVFVLDDGQPGYGRLMADGFATAARRLGLRVAGRARWDPRAAGYRRLARRVAASGAEAVFLGGLIDTNAAAVIRDLRARLGREADLMGPDGLAPIGLLEEQAGRAAVGMLISFAGVAMEVLPPAGADFAERFAAVQPGLAVEPAAIYAAQATQVVLDALARSDGTRASLLDELFATRIRDGLLGDFGFTPAGDITESPVTVLRVARGSGSRRVRSIEGGVVERVLRPPARLVG